MRVNTFYCGVKTQHTSAWCRSAFAFILHLSSDIFGCTSEKDLEHLAIGYTCHYSHPLLHVTLTVIFHHSHASLSNQYMQTVGCAWHVGPLA